MEAINNWFGAGALVFNGFSGRMLALGLALSVAFVVVVFILQRGTAKRPLKIAAFVLRWSILTLLILALAGPALRVEEPLPHQSYVAHVYDTSGSMKITDFDGKSRMDAIETQARASSGRTELDRLYGALEFSFDEKLIFRKETAKPEASDLPTNLAEAFRSLGPQIKGLPISAVFVYSDGVSTVGADPQAAIDAAVALAVPVYCVGTAPVKPGDDAWIEKIVNPGEISRGVDSKVSVLVGTRGISGASVDVILSEDGKELMRQKVKGTKEDRTANVDLTLSPTQTGAHGYQIQVKNSGTESYPWNNDQMFIVNVTDKKRRILYVEGYPRYEYRFLRAAFESDERFQVTSLVYVDRQGKNYRQGIENPDELSKGFPDTQEELFQYDVVVLGDVSARRFNVEQLTTLREFVRAKGGGLLLLGGDDSFRADGFGNTPLADVLPFTFTAQPKLTEKRRVAPTREGIERAMFGPYDAAQGGDKPWAILPALHGLYPLGGLKPGAVSLCNVESAGETDTSPVVAYQRFGRGMSLICGISATWQWKFQVPSDNPSYNAFWKEMMLVLLEQTTSRIQVKATPPIAPPGSEIAIDAEILNEKYEPDSTAKVTFDIQPPDGNPMSVTPQLHTDGRILRHKLTANTPGLYRVMARAKPTSGADIEQTCMFSVEKAMTELKEIRLNESLLTQIALATGGQYVHLTDYDALPPKVKPMKGAVMKVQEKPLWDRLPILIVLLGVLSGEWFIRRLGNLA